MIELTNTESNVLAVALDHMEEHLRDIVMDLQRPRALDNEVMNLRLDALKTLRTKLL